MFTNLLVPLDGTPQANAALPLARTVARATKAEITLIRIVPAGFAGPNSQERADAERYLEQVAAEFSADGLPVTAAVSPGEDAPAEIINEARTRASDLIVMTTHGRGGVARAVLGSVAGQVVAESPVPVLLVRPGGKRVAQLQSFLVPVDGTPGGALALGAAAGLARSCNARLVALQVTVPIPWWLYAPDAAAYVEPEWDEEARAGAQRYVDGLAGRLRQAGVQAEGRAVLGVNGNVARTIVETADKEDADLIVMSTHAHTGLLRAVLGSVADSVSRTARRPVLLVRRDAPTRPVADPLSRAPDAGPRE